MLNIHIMNIQIKKGGHISFTFVFKIDEEPIYGFS